MERKKICVGIVGVGNNAAALVQGVCRYSTAEGREIASRRQEGILFDRLCGYEIGDLEFTSAFDVDSRKIGLDLGAAIFCEPNRYPRVIADEIRTGVEVHPAPVLDGVPSFLAEMVDVAPEAAAADAESLLGACVEEVRRTGTKVLVNFLPSGSNQASLFFARVASCGGAAYINCTPTPVVHDPAIVEFFERARLPVLGDDLESQFGSSLIHRTILQALELRGLEVRHSYQVNLGGNTDFKNLTHRGDAKKASKMKAISPSTSTGNVEVLPSGGFLKGLGDNKVGYISVEGRGWLDMPVTIDIKLRVQDSSNAAGVVIDIVRLAQGALDRGIAGQVPLSYYFKNPLAAKLSTAVALEAVRQFDAGGEL